MYRPLERTMEYYEIIDVATGREKKKLLVTEAEVKQLVLSLPYSGKTLRKQVLKALRESAADIGYFQWQSGRWGAYIDVVHREQFAKQYGWLVDLAITKAEQEEIARQAEQAVSL
jgi:hypothetical protein